MRLHAVSTPRKPGGSRTLRSHRHTHALIKRAYFVVVTARLSRTDMQKYRSAVFLVGARSLWRENILRNGIIFVIDTRRELIR